MQLHGLHHVTAVTGNAKGNLDFYTQVLGLRLVKKTVNQDDVSAYHLFYADKLGTPGTDMTYFDWPQTGPNVRGTDSIANTQFRVNGRAALEYWLARFAQHDVKNNGIEQFNGRAIVRFEDPEGQRLTLVDDLGEAWEGEAWDKTDVPAEFAIRGFFAATLSIPRVGWMEPVFTQLLNFTKAATLPSLDNPDETVTIYTMDGGGAGKELHVIEQPKAGPSFLGYGGVHHIAFRLSNDEEQQAWLEKLNSLQVRHSGLVDRFYFRSLYFRISEGILFELATDDPGFDADEPLETMGQTLALPPFLEPHREQIEAGLEPL